MPDFKPPRPGEVVIDLPDNYDAGIYFIGQIHTLWKTTSDCPKGSRARAEGVEATIEIFPRFAAGLKDMTLLSHTPSRSIGCTKHSVTSSSSCLVI